MSEMEVFDITIIGAGPAGLFATFYAGLRGMKTKLVDALEDPGGQVAVLYPEKAIYDIPGFSKISGKELVANLYAQAKRFSPTMVFGERITKLRLIDESGGPKRAVRFDDEGVPVSTGRHLVELISESGRHHISRTVLVTAGVGAFSPNRLDVLGSDKYEGKGVFYFLREVDALKGKRVIVVGGGDSAVDWALALEPIAEEVTLIHRRDVFRAHEESVSQMMKSKVKVKVFYELKEVIGNGSVVTGVDVVDNRTNKVERIPADCILVNIGFRADIGPIKEWGLELAGRDIVCSGKMETSIPGVFVAGDIALPVNGVKLNLIATAFSQAAMAVNVAKTFADPKARLFPGHSSEMHM